MFADMKKCCIFAVFYDRNSFLTLLGVVFFIATNLAVKAANIGYHSNGYYTERSVIVSCMTERVAFPVFTYINNLNSSFMQLTTKNASRLSNKTPQSTSNSTKTVLTAQPRAKKHYYLVSLRAIGDWADDFKKGLYISRIVRATSKDEAVGLLCNRVKADFPRHSILAKDIVVDTFNFINPQI